jgi:hypothetical protein
MHLPFAKEAQDKASLDPGRTFDYQTTPALLRSKYEEDSKDDPRPSCLRPFQRGIIDFNGPTLAISSSLEDQDVSITKVQPEKVSSTSARISQLLTVCGTANLDQTQWAICSW